MYLVMITLKVGSEFSEIVAKGGPPLRDLCQREVASFDAYLRQHGKEYSEGLSRFERLAVEGYIYQKLRGRLDKSPEPSGLPG